MNFQFDFFKITLFRIVKSVQVHNFDISNDKYYTRVKLQCLVSRTIENISQRFMAIVYQMFYQGKSSDMIG